MVARIVWVPTIGTWTLRGSNDPFNPHDGALVFCAGPPSVPIKTDVGDEKTSANVLGDAKALDELLECASLCNIASVFQEPMKQNHGKGETVWSARGDPTEMCVSLSSNRIPPAHHLDSALQVLAHRFGRGRPSMIDQGYTQLAEYPFSSDLKRMAVIFRCPPGTPNLDDAQQDEKAKCVALMKGAVERVLDACTHVYTRDGAREIKGTHQDEVMCNVDAMAAQGLRVLGLAGREWSGGAEDVERARVETGMTFLGLVGIYDPPRAFLPFMSNVPPLMLRNS